MLAHKFGNSIIENFRIANPQTARVTPLIFEEQLKMEVRAVVSAQEQFTAVACCRWSCYRAASPSKPQPQPRPPAACLLALTPSLLSQWGSKWVTAVASRRVLTIRTKEGAAGFFDPPGPVRRTEEEEEEPEIIGVHVWVYVSPTLGVVQCGAFRCPDRLGLSTMVAGLGDGTFLMRGSREKKPFGFTLFVADASGSVVSTLGSTAEFLSLLAVSSKWLLMCGVVRDEMHLWKMVDRCLVHDEDNHVKVVARNRGHCFCRAGDISPFDGNKAVLMDNYGATAGNKVMLVDLDRTFESKKLVYSHAMDIPCHSRGCVWGSGTTLYTLHSDYRTSVAYVFNPQTKECVCSFPNAESIENIGPHHLCCAGNNKMLQVFHWSDLTTPCCGFDALQIGLLMSITPIGVLLSAPLWTALADKTRKHKIVWLVSLSLTVLLQVTLIWVHNFYFLAVVVLLVSCARSPLGAILDATVIGLVGKNHYGKQRLWGSLSWGLMAFASGFLIDRLGVYSMFVQFALLSVVYAGLLLIQFKYFPVDLQLRVQKPAIIKSTMLLLRNWDIITVLLAAFMTSFCLSSVSYVFIYIEQEFNVKKDLFGLYGLSIACTVIMEVPIFFFSQRLTDIIGQKGMLLVSHVSLILRVSFYTVMPNEWVLLPIELLHGLVIAPMMSTAVTMLSQSAPKGFETTAQSLFTATYSGLGSCIGQVVCGVVVKKLGCLFLFQAVAVIMSTFTLFSLINLIVHKCGTRWDSPQTGAASPPLEMEPIGSP
ncbi:MFS transporter [Pelomyxa schiedti]|nr:MFS transporter [Pelomyxa schiedti]